MQEILEARGWVKYYECPGCPGKKRGPKLYFSHVSHPRHNIVIRPKVNTFTIWMDNRLIAGAFWGFELETKLTANGL